MKKIINLKEVMIILTAVIIVSMSSTVFASGLVAGGNTATQIGSGEYENALTPDIENNVTTDNNTVDNNAVTNNITTNNTTGNNVKKYNTTNTVMPQTGIEDYNIGILLIICVASAIFAYKKVSDYKNI